MVEGFRLSPQQRRLWIREQEGFRGTAHCVLVISGAVGSDRLAGAVASLAARHEILRTRFRRPPGIRLPVQEVVERADFTWRELEPPPEGAPEDLVSWLSAQAAPSFDLERGPLLRALFVRQGSDRSFLHLSVPPIAADVSSLHNLFADLVRAYEGGEDAEEPVQFLQYAEWQHDHLAGDAGERGRDFWLGRTPPSGDVPPLPLEEPAPLADGRLLERRRFAVGGVREQLAALSARHGGTAAGFLLTCWNALLARLVGSGEWEIGFIQHARKFRELDEVVGPLAAAVPLAAANPPGDLAFLSAWERMERAIQEVFEWQESYPPDGAAAAPSIGFELIERPAPRRARGAGFSLLGLDCQAEPFRLKLGCVLGEATLEAVISFAPERFTSDLIDLLAERFRTILAAALAAPETGLGSLEMLGEVERRRILLEPNATRVDHPPATADRLLVAGMSLQPEADAVIAADTRLTHRELLSRVHRLARYLRGRGLQPEDRVAVCLPRSPDLVVALLGILEAGGAFLPLDPSLPQQRLHFMLADSGARLLVTVESLRGLLPDAGVPAICLDREGEVIARELDTDPGGAADPDNLAYVMYTSGSTGRPKGTLIPHRGLVNYLHWCRAHYGVGEGLGAPVHSPVGFDLTITSLLAPLFAGRALHLVPEGEAVAGLAASLRAAAGYSFVKLTPSHLEILADLLPAEEASGRAGLLVIGGEALSYSTLAFWRSHAPGTRLINEYGPTETVVGCCIHEVTPADPGGGPVPIGRPIANMRLYVLDPGLNPVPLGSGGEIFIAGEGLARGYLGRPDLTAERFVPDPWSGLEGGRGGRLYRTGDQARFVPAGVFQYLGRIDRQVKIRGHRIELDEIEQTLIGHPAVREAAVLVEEAEEARLVAWVVADAGGWPGDGELRRFLQEVLPEPMVPSVFLPLPALPLTPNGKVDREAIRRMRAAAAAAPAYLAPRTPAEILVADLWSQLLRREKVSLLDNFFDLGGHSLFAMQLVARLHSVFGVGLAINDFLEEPTVSGIAARIEAALRGGAAKALPPLRPAERLRPISLSFAQERLWLLEQLQPGTAVFNVPADFVLKGALDVRMLAAALDEIVRRHEVLRTTFRQGEEGPVQVIAPPQPQSFPRVDLSDLPPPARNAEAERLAARQARAPFDLSRGPLLRALLLRLDAEEHRLLLTLHHIVCDAWSMEILIGEWTALYAAFLQGGGSPLPPLPVQYADFASWQRAAVQGEVLADQLGFWQKRLASPPPPLDLPTSRPRPPVQTMRGAKLSRPLAADLVRRLEGLARGERVTLFMTVLAGFEALLARYAGREELLVGTPIAGRSLLQLEGLVGFFINTLVLRADLTGAPDFRHLLARVRSDTLGAFAHADLPLERLLEELPQDRDRSRPPLFQVVFSMQSPPALPSVLTPNGEAGSGLTLEALASATDTSKVDLNLEMTRSSEGLAATLEYNTDLFDPSFAYQILGHFEVLLAAAAVDPGLSVFDLDLLAGAERLQVLAQWSAGPASAVPELFLHRLFEQQAERRPKAIAVVCEGESATYEELDRRSNRLARHLGTLGIGPDQIIAVCMERSVGMVVALLAVLKAGAACLPLDPAYPMERLAAVLEDAQVPVLLTHEPASANLPVLWAYVIDVDTIGEAIADLDGSSPRVSVDPQNLAYTIYTSGSTGVPKGVLVPHAGLANLALAQAAAFAVRPESRVLQFSALSFDAFISELAMALASGAALVLASRASMMPGPDLIDLFDREAVSHVTLPPSSLAVLPASAVVPETLVVAGEACAPELVARWAPGRRFFNAYGPTESTVCATWTEIVRPEGRPPIGRPLANTRGYLLDARMMPVPPGVSGELYIGGMGVARGYLNLPALTAEKFVPDPLSGIPGSRMYRSGDLVRFRGDGQMEFLGRGDDQVKIRGFRVEPGEIEAALSRHPAVGQCAVAARPDSTSGWRLVAWFVARGGSAPSPADLRGFLQNQLPSHLVPALFVALPALPLLPNGKVDRRSLPDPDSAEVRLGRAEVLQGHLQELLEGIWRQVLGVERFGRDETFFDLGGSSLAGTQVLSRVREIFGVEVPFDRLFAKPTVAGLAGEIEDALRGDRCAPPPIVPAATGGDAPLSFAQEMMWRSEQPPVAKRFNVVPVALRLVGDLDSSLLERCLREIVRRHAALRTSFPLVDGRPVQRVGPVPAALVTLEDLTDLREEDREAAAARRVGEEIDRPFDLVEGPVLRLLLLRLGEEENLLLFVAHHIAVDQWSAGVFAQELGLLYEAFQAGAPSPLPELTVQPADFAVWQRERLRGDVLAGELSWWRGRLSGAVPVALSGVARGADGSGDPGHATESVMLSASLAGDLDSLGRRQGVTLSMTLLAAYVILLAEVTGQRDVLVASPVANRNRLEIEPLIGFFANTLILRIDLEGDPDFIGVLARVRETSVGAFIHQDLPFDLLVDSLGSELGMTREDFFRVGFNMWNAPGLPLELPGTRIEPFAVEGSEALSDILLAAAQDSEGILCQFQYRRDLFDETRAAGLCRRFRRLLGEVVANPDRRLSDLRRALDEPEEEGRP